MKLTFFVAALAVSSAFADEFAEPGTVRLSDLTDAQLVQRARLVEDHQPLFALPVTLMVLTSLTATASTAGVAGGVALMVEGGSHPWWGGAYIAIGAVMIVIAVGLAAGGLGMLRGAFSALQQRAAAARELAEIRDLRALPPVRAVGPQPILQF